MNLEERIFDIIRNGPGENRKETRMAENNYNKPTRVIITRNYLYP